MKKSLFLLFCFLTFVAQAQTFPVGNLNVTGNLQFNGNSGTSGQIPLSTGSTSPVWGAVSASSLAPIAAETLLANPTGASAAPQATTATSFFDNAYCSTVGYLIVRFLGSWTCSSAVAANPVWWGADPTGASTSTAAFNSAVSAALYVKFPPGTFLFATAPAAVTAFGEHIEGSGEGATTLVLGYTTGNFLHLTGGDIEVDGFTVGPNSDMTSGAIIEADASQNYVHDIYSVNGYNGYWFTSNCTNCFGNRLTTGNMTPHATAVGGASFLVGTAGATPPNQILLSNIVGGCTGADYGLNALSSDALQITNFELEGCAIAAMNLSPGSGSSVLHTQLANGFLDQSTTGLQISPTGTGNAQQIWAINLWVGDLQTASTAAITLGNSGTGSSSDFRCTSCEIIGTSTVGLAITSTSWKNVSVVNSCIAGNTSFGVVGIVAVNVVTLEGNIFGNCDGFGTNGTDLSISAASNNWAVQGNTFNSGTKIAGYTSLTGGGNIFTGNTSFNPVGGVTAPAIAASGSPVTNHFPFAVTVYISGTLTSVAVSGTGIYAGIGVYRVGPGQTITLGYVSAPSWIWTGD